MKNLHLHNVNIHKNFINECVRKKGKVLQSKKAKRGYHKCKITKNVLQCYKFSSGKHEI